MLEEGERPRKQGCLTWYKDARSDDNHAEDTGNSWGDNIEIDHDNHSCNQSDVAKLELFLLNRPKARGNLWGGVSNHICHLKPC